MWCDESTKEPTAVCTTDELRATDLYFTCPLPNLQSAAGAHLMCVLSARCTVHKTYRYRLTYTSVGPHPSSVTHHYTRTVLRRTMQLWCCHILDRLAIVPLTGWLHFLVLVVAVQTQGMKELEYRREISHSASTNKHQKCFSSSILVLYTFSFFQKSH